MSNQPNNISQWAYPLAFIACASWVIWHGATYIMAFGGFTDALSARYRSIIFIDYIVLAAVPVLFILGMLTVRRAKMEYEDWGIFDRMAVFIGRITMLLIVLVVAVMIYEVLLRYVFESPTLWANEMSLWMAGFVFVLAGLYAMQQRSHIRIYLLYDIFPRNLQRACDVFSTFLISIFAFALIYGGYGEAKAKLLRWETFGTAFDPPIPATLKPLVLLVITLVALQAIANLIKDWNKAPEIHSAADDIDQEEIDRLKKQMGSM
jgi:TRAP-type mannitol/chloroaromatic compound transport system permease small subunit